MSLLVKRIRFFIKNYSNYKLIFYNTLAKIYVTFKQVRLNVKEILNIYI